jgi:hypothetical protein
MFYYEVEKDIAEGKQVRRAGWPAGDRISKAPADTLELDEDDLKAAGLDADANVTVGDVFIYSSGKKCAVYGYQLTSSDKVSQDWELVVGK